MNPRATGRKRSSRYWLCLRCLWCGSLVMLQRSAWAARYAASGRWSPFCGRRCYGLWASVEARRRRNAAQKQTQN